MDEYKEREECRKKTAAYYCRRNSSRRQGCSHIAPSCFSFLNFEPAVVRASEVSNLALSLTVIIGSMQKNKSMCVCSLNAAENAHTHCGRHHAADNTRTAYSVRIKGGTGRCKLTFYQLSHQRTAGVVSGVWCLHSSISRVRSPLQASSQLFQLFDSAGVYARLAPSCFSCLIWPVSTLG